MTWLLILARVKSALSAAFGWMRANPSLAVIIALCVALAWTWHGKHKAEQRIAAIEVAQKAATGAQKAVNHAAEVHYQEVANVADTHHADMVADAFDATARYVQSHRVQPEGGACKAPAPATDSDTGVHPELPAAGVVVSDVDVQRCAAWQAYGVAANSWAQSLKLPEDLVPTP